jgi:oligopeptide transport system ATP-binding protein
MLEPHPACRDERVMAAGPLFAVENVSKVFRLRSAAKPWGRRAEVQALSNVCLDIREREVFGIIGESGSGKSTLGFLLADIEAPTSGTIRFRGQALNRMGRGERKRFRQRVQVVFQDSGSALNPRRKIGAVLRDSLTLSGLPGARHEHALKELLVSVGLAMQHADRYPHQLSGGQRQRVGIARALAMQPEVLIADEPASALDVSVQAQILNLLLDLREKLNLTIVLISHDIAVVHHASDRIAVMRGGEVLETNTAEEVIRAPCHDYTRSLIAAVPKGLRDPTAETAPFVIAGLDPAIHLFGKRMDPRAKPAGDDCSA